MTDTEPTIRATLGVDDRGAHRSKPSLRNQLRALERLLRWPKLDVLVLAEKKRELEHLRRVYEKKRSEAEKAAITRKYLSIRKVEEGKILRKLQELKDRSCVDADYDTQETRRLERDLMYVRNFPDGVKYVALFPKSGHTPRAKRLIERYRKRIERQCSDRGLMQAARIPDTDAREQREKQDPEPQLLESPMQNSKMKAAAGTESDEQAQPAQHLRCLEKRDRNCARPSGAQMRQHRGQPKRISLAAEKATKKSSSRRSQAAPKNSTDIYSIYRTHGYALGSFSQTRADRLSGINWGTGPGVSRRSLSQDPLLEPDENPQNPNSPQIAELDDDDDDSIDRHVFIARIKCPEEQTLRFPGTRRSRGRGRRILTDLSAPEAAATIENALTGAERNWSLEQTR
jgi:hypothetical protein